MPVWTGPFGRPNRADMRGCLEGMIQFVDDFSQENDKRQREDFASKNPISFAKELRTVKFGLCRRAGHTTAISWYASHHMKEVYLFLLGRDQLSLVPDPPDNLHLRTHNKHRLRGHGGAGPNIVFVDCAALVSKKKLNRIYRAFAGNCPGSSIMGHRIPNFGNTPIFVLVE